MGEGQLHREEPYKHFTVHRFTCLGTRCMVTNTWCVGLCVWAGPGGGAGCITAPHVHSQYVRGAARWPWVQEAFGVVSEWTAAELLYLNNRLWNYSLLRYNIKEKNWNAHHSVGKRERRKMISVFSIIFMQTRPAELGCRPDRQEEEEECFYATS